MKKVKLFSEQPDNPGNWRVIRGGSARYVEKLTASFHLDRLEHARTQGSADATRKFLFRLHDNRYVESVLIPANPALYGTSAARRRAVSALLSVRPRACRGARAAAGSTTAAANTMVIATGRRVVKLDRAWEVSWLIPQPRQQTHPAHWLRPDGSWSRP